MFSAFLVHFRTSIGCVVCLPDVTYSHTLESGHGPEWAQCSQGPHCLKGRNVSESYDTDDEIEN